MQESVFESVFTRKWTDRPIYNHMEEVSATSAFSDLMQLPAILQTGWTTVNDSANGTDGIKETAPGIRADPNVAGSLFHSGTAIRADLCDWELVVNVDGSFARWWIIVAINNMTLVSPLL